MSWQDNYRTIEWGKNASDEVPHVLVTSGNMYGNDCGIIMVHGNHFAKYRLKRAAAPSKHSRQKEGKTPLSYLQYPRMHGVCITLSHGKVW